MSKIKASDVVKAAAALITAEEGGNLKVAENILFHTAPKAEKPAATGKISSFAASLDELVYPGGLEPDVELQVPDDVQGVLDRLADIEIILTPVVGRAYRPPLHRAWAKYEKSGDLVPFRAVVCRLREFALRVVKAAWNAATLATGGESGLKRAHGLIDPLIAHTVDDKATRDAWEALADREWEEFRSEFANFGGEPPISEKKP